MSFIHKPPMAVARSMHCDSGTSRDTPSCVVRTSIAAVASADHPHFGAWLVAKSRSSADHVCIETLRRRIVSANASRAPWTCTYLVSSAQSFSSLDPRTRRSTRRASPGGTSTIVPLARASPTSLSRVMEFIPPSECVNDFGATLALMYTAIAASGVLAIASLLK